MDLLIVEPLEDELMQWLEARHSLRFAPELALDPRALRQALYDVRAVVVPASVAMDAQALRHAPVLRALGRVSAGPDSIDAEACSRAGVEVVRSRTACAQAEAEFMIGALLCLLRRVPVVGADGGFVGRELGAACVGLLGMAPAARPLTQLLSAFGSRVLGYDPSLHASDAVWERWHVKPVGLHELLEQCDAVCVQLAYFSRYHGLLGERFLQFCKPDQVIVSIAHAGLFDEAAFADALASGRIAGAWLDSVEPGMLDEGRPLYGMPNLQITPRLSGTTRESRLRSSWTVVKRIDEILGQVALAPREFRSSGAGVPIDLAGSPTLQ
ncbi:MAG: NAD(P)-dependent oxidoreductase [Burkholderiaceae bacterium]